MTDADAGQKACFEAGIKLGALYHQFIGTPVSRDSVESLETAIEESVLNQRYVESATVSIKDVEPNQYGYTELSGTMLSVEVVVETGEARVRAVLEETDGYPLMEVREVTRM